MMKSKKIIISGPPGSGKTSIINSLLKKGYNCFQEINPTKIKTIEIKNDKFLLSEYLFQKRLKEYTKNINQLLQEIYNGLTDDEKSDFRKRLDKVLEKQKNRLSQTNP